MATVVLIKELTANGHIAVHQIHTTWENARETLRQTFSTVKGLTIQFKANGKVGGLNEEFVTVTFDGAAGKVVQRFGLTEMPVFETVDHL